ncbi:MAG: UbiA family prenyltransferase [Candidatus Kariarchaeaceae archaeon]
MNKQLKILSYLRLFRIFETSMIAGSVIMALILLGSTNFSDFILISVAIWLTGAGISSWNDSLDVKEDTISHPNRPIPSGRVTIRAARLLGSTFVIIGIIFGFYISVKAGILIIGSSFVGIIYSLSTKRFLFLKNLTVIISGVVVLALIPDIFNLNKNFTYNYFIVSISILLFSYEVLKDIHDIEGDAEAGINTIIVQTSPNTGAKLSTSLFVSSCLIMSFAFADIEYYTESLISVITAFLILIPAKNLIDDPSPSNSEKLRYVIVSIILISLSIVGLLILNRNLST